MFSAFPLNPLLVAGAITSGNSFLKCDFAATVAGVSIMSTASLEIVFPVAGTIIAISVILFFPIDSAS